MAYKRQTDCEVHCKNNTDKKVASKAKITTMSPPKRIIAKVDSTNVAEVASGLNTLYSENRGKLETSIADDGLTKLFYIGTSAGKDEGIILQVGADAAATIFRVVGKERGIATVNVDVVQAKVAAWANAGAGAGVCISANLINAQASVFDLTLGIGLSTGVGIKDDSLHFTFLGSGFKLGRKVGVSAFDNYFGIDFGRCHMM